MPRNYKHILSVIVVTIGLFAFSQEKAEYKDVILDGKPAKLNIATGEIKLVKPKENKQETKQSETNKKAEVIQGKEEAIVGIHVVREGETLSDISKYYNVSVVRLKEENNLESNTLKEGQILEVKNFRAKSARSAEVETIAENKTTSEPQIAPELQTQFHTVKEGETLLDIARKYKVSLVTLKSKNNLESTLVNEGQILQVKNFDVNAKPPTNAGDVNTSKSSFHIVKKGETLFSLAKQYGLSLQELKSLNNLNSNIIKVGQKLRVSKKVSSSTTSNNSVYIVEKDDTLFSIAKKNGLSVNQLKSLNGLSNNTIYVGQKLRIK